MTATKRNQPQKPRRVALGQRDVALDALLDGASKGEAARRANVDPHTISEWMAEGHEFRLEYDKRREDINAGADERRTLLRLRAMDRVSAAISDDGDEGLRAALEYLRLVEPKRVEQSGPGGGPMRNEVSVKDARSDEQVLEDARRILEAKKGGQ